MHRGNCVVPIRVVVVLAVDEWFPKFREKKSENQDFGNFGNFCFFPKKILLKNIFSIWSDILKRGLRGLWGCL